jgi:hypothetical protein
VSDLEGAAEWRDAALQAIQSLFRAAEPHAAAMDELRERLQAGFQLWGRGSPRFAMLSPAAHLGSRRCRRRSYEPARSILRALRTGFDPEPCRGLNSGASAARRLRRCSTSSGGSHPCRNRQFRSPTLIRRDGAPAQARGSRCQYTSCPAARHRPGMSNDQSRICPVEPA